MGKLSDYVREVFETRFPFSLISNVILYRNDRSDTDLFANEIDFLFHYCSNNQHRLAIIEVKDQVIFGQMDGSPPTTDGPWNARYCEDKKNVKKQLSNQVMALEQYCKQISETPVEVEAWVVDNRHGNHLIQSSQEIKFKLLTKNAFQNQINSFPHQIFRIEHSGFLRELRRGMVLPDTGHPEIPNAIRFIRKCRDNLDSRLYSVFDPTENYFAINGCAGMGKSVLLAYGIYVLATDYCVKYDNISIQLKPYKDIAIKNKWPLHEKRKIYAYAVKQKQIEALETYWVLIKKQISQVNPTFQPALQVPKFEKWQSRIPSDCNCLIIDKSHDLSLDDQKMIADWTKIAGRFLMVACDRNQAVRRRDDEQYIIRGINFSRHTRRLNRIYRCPFPVYVAAVGLLFRWFAKQNLAITLQDKQNLSTDFGFKPIVRQENRCLIFSMRNDCHPGNNWQQTVSYFNSAERAYAYISEFNLKREAVLWACFEKTSDNFDYTKIQHRYTWVDLTSMQAENEIDKHIKGQEFYIVFVEGLPPGMNPSDMVQNSHGGKEQSESEKKMWKIRKNLYIVCSRASAFLYFVTNIDRAQNADIDKLELRELIHQVSRPTWKENESGKTWTFTIKEPEIRRAPSQFIETEEHGDSPKPEQPIIKSVTIQIVDHEEESIIGNKRRVDIPPKPASGDRTASGFRSNPDTVTRVSKENVTKPLPLPTFQQPARIGFILDGRHYPARNAREVLIGVFEALSKRNANILERFAELPKHGRTRRYLARNPDDLYSNRPDLVRDFSLKLTSGWWISTNHSRATILKIIEMVCDVAHLKYGSDLQVNVGE